MKKIIKWAKVFILGVIGLFLLVFLGLFFYTLNSAKADPMMYESLNALDTSKIEVKEYHDRYFFAVDKPLGNIVFIQGGKVEANAYLYLAYQLALNGFQVSLTKAYFNLAILNPFYNEKFLVDYLPNIVIGHSLGGAVGSMIAASSHKVDYLVLLGSYSNAKINDTKVLLITATNDLVMNKGKYQDALSLLPPSSIEKTIIGGNHAGFGWYGKQKNDGIATISNKEQQDLTLHYILDFIKESV